MVLSEEEYAIAESFGHKRQDRYVRTGRGVREPKDKGGTWRKRNVLGTVAEYALAKTFNVLDRWLETQAYSENPASITSDVGNNVQVRATDLDYGSLLLHDYDPDDAPFVCAVVHDRDVTFAGWIYGRMGKKKTYWWASTRPCYRVPVECLIDMRSFPKEAI